MGFANVKIEREHYEEQQSQLKLQNWKFTYLCDLLLHNFNNNKMEPRVTLYICLHSSNDSWTSVYTRQVTHLCF